MRKLRFPAFEQLHRDIARVAVAIAGQIIQRIAGIALADIVDVLRRRSLEVRLFARCDICLLYTSPSPRD